MISDSKDCSSNFLSQEGEINKILESASSYSIIGDILQIRYNDQTLSFSAINESPLTSPTSKFETTSIPKPPTDSSSLYNQNWYFLSYEGFVALEGYEPFVYFSSDGSISGNTGCNSLSGTFSSNQNFISVYELTSTKELCKEPYSTQEEIFLKALKNSQTYSLNGDRLRIKSQIGVLILSNYNLNDDLKPATTEIQPSNTPYFTSTSTATTEPIIIQPHTKTPTPTNEQIITGPIAIIEGPHSGEAGNSISLSGMKSYSNSEIVSYLWDFGDGIKGQGEKINYTYVLPGRYTITLTITDSNGETNSTTMQIDIKYK